MTEFPTADAAEAIVVAVCIESRFGLARVVDVVTAADFWQPPLRRVFAIVPMLDDLAPFRSAPVDSAAVRIGAASVLADVPIACLQAIVNGPVPVMFDARRWAIEVAEAAKRRRIMSALSRAHAAVAQGEPLDAAAELVLAAGEEIVLPSRALERALPELQALLTP